MKFTHNITIQEILIILLTSMFLILGSASRIFAQEPQVPQFISTPTPQSDVQTMPTNVIRGEVVKVEGRVITLDSESEIKQITVPETIRIQKNTMKSVLEDIQPGDEITVQQIENGELISINVITGGILDWGKWIIPILILLLILFGLLWWFIQKTNKSHIKTTVGN